MATVEILIGAGAMASCLFALLLGGSAERLGAGTILAGSLPEWPFGMLTGSGAPAFPPLAIDLLVLIVLTPLALKSTRYWPLWSTGFQITLIATDIAAELRFSTPAAIIPVRALWMLAASLAVLAGALSAARRRSLHSIPSRSTSRPDPAGSA